MAKDALVANRLNPKDEGKNVNSTGNGWMIHGCQRTANHAENADRRRSAERTSVDSSGTELVFHAGMKLKECRKLLSQRKRLPPTESVDRGGTCTTQYLYFLLESGSYFLFHL
jgi:hypothetical protein